MQCCMQLICLIQRGVPKFGIRSNIESNRISNRFDAKFDVFDDVEFESVSNFPIRFDGHRIELDRIPNRFPDDEFGIRFDSIR